MHDAQAMKTLQILKLGKSQFLCKLEGPQTVGHPQETLRMGFPDTRRQRVCLELCGPEWYRWTYGSRQIRLMHIQN